MPLIYSFGETAIRGSSISLEPNEQTEASKQLEQREQLIYKSQFELKKKKKTHYSFLKQPRFV